MYDIYKSLRPKKEQWTGKGLGRELKNEEIGHLQQTGHMTDYW